MTDGSRHLSGRQGVDAALQLLTGQWEVSILAALAAGPLRTAEILRNVNAVDDELGRHEHPRPLSMSVLARNLDRLEDSGLLIRHDETVKHPSVRYELTNKARTLLQALRPLAAWAEMHLNTKD